MGWEDEIDHKNRMRGIKDDFDALELNLFWVWKIILEIFLQRKKNRIFNI